MIQNFLQTFRSRLPYAALLVAVAPAYAYIFSERFDMKREWKREISGADIKLKEDESRMGRTFNPERHLVVEMANRELDEHLQMNQAQATYRTSARDTIKPKDFVSPETLEGREKRAKIRALRRRAVNNTISNDETTS